MDVRVVDPATGSELPERRVGEIWIGGDTVGDGYWHRPEETRLAFRGPLCPDRTGVSSAPATSVSCPAGNCSSPAASRTWCISRGRNHHPEDVELSLQLCHPALSGALAAAFAVEVLDEEQLAVVVEVPRLAEPNQLADIVEAVRAAIWAHHEIEVQPDRPGASGANPAHLQRKTAT